jgi:nitrile hydratase accessory protein
MDNEPRVSRLIANMEGPAALPRKNGELVFDEPWETRALGMAIILNDRLFSWDEFRAQLQEELGRITPGETPRYYARWLASLERLLIEKGAITPAELEARTAEYRSGDRDEVF